jgi:hypothetical protein
MAADLRALAAHRPISVAEPSLGHLARLWLRRHSRGVAVVGTIVLGAAGAWAAAWTAESLGTRSAVRAELARIRPERYTDPGELERAFEPLMELQRRASAFEASALRRPFGLAEEVRRTVHAWSQRLATLLATDKERAEHTGLALQDMVYRRLVWQDEQLCPDCPYNAEDRRRGRVGFPHELLSASEYELTRLGPVSRGSDWDLRRDPDSLSAFQPTAFSELLVPGTYRLQVWEAGAPALASETVFHVEEGWLPFLPVDPRPPAADWLGRTASIPRSRHALSDGRQLVVPAFRILADLVTVGDFARFCSETEEPSTEFRPDADPSLPAWVAYDSAMRFAAWRGGRLPTRMELVHAGEAGKVVLPQPSESIGVGEFVLDPARPWLPDPGYLVYGEARVGMVPDRRTAVKTGTNAGSLSAPLAFRIAFSTDAPELYREVARNPFDK